LVEGHVGLKVYSDVLVCQSPNHAFNYISVISSCSEVPQNPLKDPGDGCIVVYKAFVLCKWIN
jgi:hypothetical protein